MNRHVSVLLVGQNQKGSKNMKKYVDIEMKSLYFFILFSTL